ncbi:MAG: hypothetical protein VB959_03495 [Rhodospirillales bacterium]
MFEPLLPYARKLGSALQEGLLQAAKTIAKKAVLAIAYAGSDYIKILAAGLPEYFGWVNFALSLLKSWLNKDESNTEE